MIFIKFLFKYLNESALHVACRIGKANIVKLLLSHKGIDINAKSIFNSNFFMKFII